MNELTEQAGQLTWLEKVIEKGVDAPTLEKLIELKHRMNERLAKQAFALAMNAAQQEMPRMVKTTKGQNGLYATLESIKDTIMPTVLKHGFSLSWSTGHAELPGTTLVLCTLYHVGGHSHLYEGTYPIDGQGAKGGNVMNALQGTISAHTYAQRDMLRLMFDLTIAGQDKDGAKDNDKLTDHEIESLNTLIEEYQNKPGGLTQDSTKLFAWLASVAGQQKLDSLADLPRSALKRVVSGIKALGAKGGK